MGPPPVADDEHNERIGRLASTLLAEAVALNIPHIDLFTPLVTNDAYRVEVARGDGAHPTATGYDQIARCVRMSPAWWFG